MKDAGPFRSCDLCGQPIPINGPARCRACNPIGGTCCSCGAPVSQHRTRRGRWIGCRPSPLRVVRSESVTTETARVPEALGALAEALAQDAPPFDLPFALTAEPARVKGHQLGLFEVTANEENEDA